MPPKWIWQRHRSIKMGANSHDTSGGFGQFTENIKFFSCQRQYAPIFIDLCHAACGEIWEGYENSLMAHIRHIREKIEEDPSSPQSLILIRGLGYKLIIEET